jgi:hypothetical protein
VPRSLPQEANLAAHRLPTDERSSRAPGLSWSATRSTWPLPNHLPRRRPSPNRHLRWPSTACASFQRQAPTRADQEPVVDAAGDHADPGHPSHAAACPPPRSTTHFGRTQRTRERTDTGHRTPDTGTLRRPHRTLDTGPVDRHAWTLVARTGHWTPNAGRGRGQGDEGTAGIRTSWPPPERPPAGRRAVFPWTAPAALGSPGRLGGEAPASARDAYHGTGQLLGRSVGQAAPRRTAVLGRFRVERRASGDASSVMASLCGVGAVAEQGWGHSGDDWR